MGIEDIFKIECQKAFRFLIDEFHCKLVPDSFSDSRSACIYRNTTTGLIVSLELDYPGLFVMFLKLVDGRIPKEPFNHGFYLSDLITLRAPNLHYSYGMRELWDPKKVKEIVYTYAYLTRQHASDILGGEFLVFKDLEKIVRDRAVHFQEDTDELNHESE